LEECILRYLSSILFCLSLLLSVPVNAKSFKLRLSDGSQLSTFIYKPKGKGPHPAIIVLPVRSGMNQYSKTWSSRMAQKGYVVLTVNYRTGRGWPDQKVGEAYDYLKELPGVNGEAIAVVGFSFGGQRGLEFVNEWANGYPPRPVKAMIAYYPGSNVPFPSVDTPPILFLHGELDEVKPKTIEDFCSETIKAGRHCEYNIYKNTTHSFTHPTKYRSRYKGESVSHAKNRKKWQYSSAAEKDAFVRSVVFLEKQLKNQAAQ